MASPSPSPLRAPHLQPTAWVAAALSRLGQDGIEAVRVEVLARDLGVSKGSFYWHFRDREQLLERLLQNWQESESKWLDGEENGVEDRSNPATRWARFVARCADTGRAREELALRSWARRDERVAAAVRQIEERKARLVASVLTDIGFSASEAQQWSDTVNLIHLGWLDRIGRDANFRETCRPLGEFLSDVVLAASAKSSANR